jgi:hypothetical protein
LLKKFNIPNQISVESRARPDFPPLFDVCFRCVPGDSQIFKFSIANFLQILIILILKLIKIKPKIERRYWREGNRVDQLGKCPV